MADTKERIKKKRALLRSTVDEVISFLDEALGQDPCQALELEVNMTELDEHFKALQELDGDYMDCLLDADKGSDQECEDERRNINGYARRIRLVKAKVNAKLYPQVQAMDAGSTASISTAQKQNLRLPKITLKKFSGELTDWLGWWAQFKTIDGNESIHDSDKFTYLLQSMKEGSRALEVVKRFPQSTENYPKALSALTERFGKPKLLRQVYVRELIRMILDSRGKDRTSLCTLHDKLEASLRSLQSLGVNTEQMMEFLYPMVESSLPEETLLAWQRSSNYGREGTTLIPPMSELDYLMAFLKSEVEHEEARKLAREGFGLHSEHKKLSVRRVRFEEGDDVPTAAGLHNGSTESHRNSCIFCGRYHPSQECRKAQSMSLEERKKLIEEKRVCYACLKTGHIIRKCKEVSKIKCTKCSRHHYAIMCSGGEPKEGAESEKKGKDYPHSVSTNLNFSNDVALKTLMVRLVNPVNRKSTEVRVLIDSGSQRSFVSKRAAETVGLKSKDSVLINHTVFGGTQVTCQTHEVYDLCLVGLNSKSSALFRMMDQTRICGPISRVAKGPWLSELKHRRIIVTDLDPEQPSDIDILIGADYYGTIITGRMLTLENGLTAVETTLGWSLIGQPKSKITTALSVISMSVSSATVAELWSLETIGIRDPAETKSTEERERETHAHFSVTVTQDSDGRYSVSLPWVSDGARDALPSNYDIAYKRLQATTKRLNSLTQFGNYNAVFKEWELEGFITAIADAEEQRGPGYHYLPHRAVFKESKTTPVRPVFDASCRAGRNPSLNGCLEKGPNFLELIPSILLRFRMGLIGAIADIRKAFLMIELSAADRNAVRFLWWEDDTQKRLKVYQHNRVVLGMNCSPFLLSAVIGHHLQRLRIINPEVADKLESSLYVDNLVTAVNTKEEYEHLKKVATDCLSSAKMELRQWERSGEPGENKVTGVLGLKWDKVKDTLPCDVLPAEIPPKITKRIILSRVQSIFDPLGFLRTTVLIPKVLLQKTWMEDKQWDAEVSKETEEEFMKWWEELSIIRNRFDGIAHMDSYSHRIIVKFTFSETQAKTRVAPVKQVTIPRLELLSCTIAARLSSTIRKTLKLESVPLYHWSDSTTALAWIRRSADWGTFVGNRVKEIVELTLSATWRHVPGELPSRGISPSKFAKSRWWEGPEWLIKDEKHWPSTNPDVDEREVAMEVKKLISTFASTSSSTPWYMTSNDYGKNLRIIVYVLRFIRKSKGKGQKGTSKRGPVEPPSTVETREAELTIWRIIQNESFSNSNVIEGIRVERDSTGLIRVRTKLLQRQDSVDFQLPVLLPHSHPMIDCLIREEHVFNCHGGAQLLMGRIREKAWIIRSRQAIRRVLRSCVTCRRFDARKCDVPPSALPQTRVKDATAFEVTGVDLAGPLVLRNGQKAYIVLYTCAVYRCVHLDVTESLSTEDFLLSLQRFCSRKRRPTTIYSDNGTNFRGANNLFKRINWKVVAQRSLAEKMEWHFNPPAAPWWGGWWERLIRSVKDLLRRMLGRRKLTYVELETCLCEVEAAMNNRPLSFVTEDQDDLTPLTPAMFITCLPNSDYPEAELISAESFGRRGRSLRTLLEELKGRFRKEYLAQLVQRGKERIIRNFKIGEVVLVQNDNEKRIFWPMGRILELIPGNDGEVRVAKVKTSNGVLTRPLQRLFPLEVGPEETLLNSAPEEGKIEKVMKPSLPAVESTSDSELPQSTTKTEVIRTSKGREVVRPAKLKDFVRF